MYGVPHHLARDTAGPTDDRPVKSLAFPPLGITTGGMHRHFKSARESFPELISSHEESLAVRITREVEFDLLCVGLVVLKSVFSESSGLLGCPALLPATRRFRASSMNASSSSSLTSARRLICDFQFFRQNARYDF